MKINLHYKISLLLVLVLLSFSCEEEDDLETLDGNPNLPTECDFTNYNGATNCDDGLIAVSDDSCCPIDFPFWWVGTSSCYSSCEAAQSAGASQIVRGNNGSGGGNNNTTGDASFWIQSDLGCGPITVSIAGQGDSTINSFYSNGFPGCGANGNANYTLPAGNYSYTASCNGLSWQGNFTINPNGCSNIQLSGSGGGSGGGGNGCNWDKGDLLSVTGEVGTRCGSPTSYLMTVTNNSNIKVKAFICIRRANGTYSGFGDGNGLDPGESFSSYICDGNGQYILYAEYWDIYEANGFCNYGGCP